MTKTEGTMTNPAGLPLRHSDSVLWSSLVIGGSLVGHSPFRASLQKSFETCRAITRAAHSSFPVAFRLLPPAKRRAMDALYARFVKPGGALAMAGAGLMREFDGPVPEHLRKWWEPGLCCLHSAQWWRQHWERSGLITVERADTMPEG